ncbi:MAG: Pr6Pr family membrane protein [Erysipelotrichaceae bacterium]|nr:Pr6Pr family membrane protein [Erysipelotrichaceae bacterium]
MRDKLSRIGIKLIGIISSLYGMCVTINSWKSFTYFTILSNVFIIVMLGIFLVYDVLDKKKSNSLYIIKYLATTSITLTFLVFMFILAPTIPGGFLNAYGGGSFYIHFLTPFMGILDYFLFDYAYESTSIHAIYGIIPPIVYVLFAFTLGILGVRWQYDMVVPYNFINYKAPTGWFGFDLSIMGKDTLGIGVAYVIVILIVLFILLGRLFLFIKEIRRKSIEG